MGMQEREVEVMVKRNRMFAVCDNCGKEQGPDETEYHEALLGPPRSWVTYQRDATHKIYCTPECVIAALQQVPARP